MAEQSALVVVCTEEGVPTSNTYHWGYWDDETGEVMEGTCPRLLKFGKLWVELKLVGMKPEDMKPCHWCRPPATEGWRVDG